MTLERTVPQYRTFGPDDGTGRTWHEYARDIKGRVEDVATDSADPADTDDDLDQSLPSITVIHPPREIGLGWPSVITTWRNRLLANDWTVKVGYCKAHHEDLYHKNGNLKKAAHDEEQYWVNAVKDKTYITVSYNFVDGKANSQRTVRQVRGELRNHSDADMQKVIKGNDTSTE